MRARLRAWGLPLWDLLLGRPRPEPSGAAPRPAPPGRPVAPEASAEIARPPSTKRATRRGRARPAMADRYDAMARAMLAEHGVRVRKWRTAMSGVAWELKYHDGTVRRLIEAPRPRGPMSAAIFLHEIGHHAIGFNRYRPRCLEEYHAWAFSLEQMERHGLRVTDAVRRRVHLSLHYAIGKARRRGLITLPPELEPYVVAPPRSKRAKRR